jgi:hypothetical protein
MQQEAAFVDDRIETPKMCEDRWYHGRAMKRPYRILAAFVTTVAFVFAQAAASAFACAAPVQDRVAMAQMKAAMAQDGALCEQHCATGTLSLDAAKPTFAPAVAVMPVSARIAAFEVRAASTITRVVALSVTGPAPPLIRFTVLRI